MISSNHTTSLACANPLGLITFLKSRLWVPVASLSIAIVGCGGGGNNPLPPSSLTYNTPIVAEVGVELQPLSPRVGGSGLSFSVTPEFPEGLALDPSTGVISGTAQVAASNATYSITASNSAGQSTFNLVLTTIDLHVIQTAVTLAIPTASASKVTTVISVVDSQSPGASLSIPTNTRGLATPLFAIDSQNNIQAASYANTSQTSFTADSTATAFVLLTLGNLTPTSMSYSQLVGTIQSVSDYGTLVNAVTTSQQTGQSPISNSEVIQETAAVVNEVLESFATSSQTASIASIRKQDRSSTLTATSSLPFQIFGPFATFPSFESVYINAVNADGVTVVNNMPISWIATSEDQNGNTLDAGETLPGVSALLAAVESSSTKGVNVSGMEPMFTLTVAQTTDSRKQNVQLLLSDYISFSISQITGLAPSGLAECESSAVDSIYQALGDTTQQALLNTPDGLAASALLATSLPANVLYQGLRAALTCAVPGSASLKVLANLAGWTVPQATFWKAINFVASAAGPATDSALTWFYWNASQAVDVCEANGSLVACTGQTYEYVGYPFNAPAANCDGLLLPGPIKATVTFNKPIPQGYTGYVLASTPVDGNDGIQFSFTISTEGIPAQACTSSNTAPAFCGGDVQFIDGSISTYYLFYAPNEGDVGTNVALSTLYTTTAGPASELFEGAGIYTVLPTPPGGQTCSEGGSVTLVGSPPGSWTVTQ